MSNGPGEPLHFFISRAGANAEDIMWAKWVRGVLMNHGYTCFLQDTDIHVGNDFHVEMETELNKADRLIAILSPEYSLSNDSMRELRTMYDRDRSGRERRVLMVRVVPGCTMPSFPGLVYLNLDHPNERSARILLNEIVMPEEPVPAAPGVDIVSSPESTLISVLKREFLSRYLDRVIREARIRIQPPLESSSKSGNTPLNREEFFKIVDDVKKGGRLLIAGNEGSGKTILLLECVKSLLPEDPAGSFIPIVLNVSTWVDPKKPASGQQHIREWLVRQFFSQYGIPEELSEPLIRNERLIYCLDDFYQLAAADESDRPEAKQYRLELRERFLSEMVEFLGRRSSRGLAGVIMTVRSEQPDDVLRIEQSLDLDFVRVNVCPLDPAEILRRVRHTDLGRLYEWGTEYSEVRDMCANPLDLQILCRVTGMFTSRLSADNIEAKIAQGNFKDHVYNTFIQEQIRTLSAQQQREMRAKRRHWFAGRRAGSLSQDEILPYLRNIAAYLRNRDSNRRTFRIDELQPRELPDTVFPLYRTLASIAFALAVVVIAGTVSGLATGFEWVMLRHDPWNGIAHGLITFAAVGFFGGAVVALGYRWLDYRWVGAAIGLAFAIVRGFVIGLAADVPGAATLGAAEGVRQGAITALVSIPVFWWLLYKVKDNPKSIEPIELYQPDKGRMRSSLAIGMASGVCFWLFLGPARGISFGGLIAIVLVTFFAKRHSEAPIKIRPNQAIEAWKQHAVFFASRFTLATSALFGCVYGYFHGFEEGINNAILGLAGAILFLFFGGMPFLKHMALRVTLALKGFVPWRLEEFLKDADKIGLVRQVGAGFTFPGPLRNCLAKDAPAEMKWGRSQPDHSVADEFRRQD